MKMGVISHLETHAICKTAKKPKDPTNLNLSLYTSAVDY